MKCKLGIPRFDLSGNMSMEILCGRTEGQKVYEKYKDKEIDIEFKTHRKKRSLDANAYMWVLLGEMARVLETDKDSIYLKELERYGVYDVINIPVEADFDKFKQSWRLCREIGIVFVDDIPYRQVMCFYGSHTYDSNEFPRFYRE